VEPRFSCDGVYQKGGLCGGGTYAVSRAALERLSTAAHTVEDFVKHVASLGAKNLNSDMSSSCLFHAHGVEFSKEMQHYKCSLQTFW